MSRSVRHVGTHRGPRSCLANATVWLLLTIAPTMAAAAPPDGAVIMANADRMNRADFEIARLRMELRGSDGSPQARELTWHLVGRSGTRTSLLKFTSPASMRGIGTLVIEADNQPSAVWHHIPATRDVRRIAAEHRQNRFMGTEFSFEDFEGLKLDKYAFTLLRSEACRDGNVCHVVEGTASDPAERESSAYSRKVFWIDQRTHAIVRIELFDPAGTLAKVFARTDFHLISGYWRPRRQVMTDVRSGRSTTLIEIEYKLSEPFDLYYVSQQYLRSR